MKVTPYHLAASGLVILFFSLGHFADRVAGPALGQVTAAVLMTLFITNLLAEITGGNNNG